MAHLKKGRPRAILAAAALAIGLAAGLTSAVISTVPAQASSVHAQASGAASHARQAASPDTKGALLCGGDVCIQSLCAGCATQSIHVWADTYGFTGHFEISYGCSMAGCTVQNSTNVYWHAGGSGWIFGGVPGAAESATVTAWEGGPPWTDIGGVFFYLL
jgi:hypothetical protein